MTTDVESLACNRLSITDTLHQAVPNDGVLVLACTMQAEASLGAVFTTEPACDTSGGARSRNGATSFHTELANSRVQNALESRDNGCVWQPGAVKVRNSRDPTHSRTVQIPHSAAHLVSRQSPSCLSSSRERQLFPWPWTGRSDSRKFRSRGNTSSSPTGYCITSPANT